MEGGTDRYSFTSVALLSQYKNNKPILNLQSYAA
jgi:hypothetical protein